MGVVGADVAAIRNFAQGLNRRSQEITATTARLTKVVENIPWVGADRERFIAEWNSTHLGLLGLLEDLAEAAKNAIRHADEQEAASADHQGGW